MPALREKMSSWLGGNPDDDLLRWLYRGLIVATVAVIALDYGNLARRPDTGPPSIDQPPSAEPLPATPRDGDKRRRAPVRETSAKLREPMTFELTGDGRLLATGAITPGISRAFAAEVEKRGSYIKTVVLQSPGGSVRDALEMGRLIRKNKFATEVEANRYCASSCPLVFAGGVERRAGPQAAIGVHQVSALGQTLSGDDGMDSAQQISAICQKYLREMGIDLGVWVHAMETPRDELYYFKPDELMSLKLATSAEKPAKRKT